MKMKMKLKVKLLSVKEEELIKVKCIMYSLVHVSHFIQFPHSSMKQ